jgi:hypothetical protein
MAYFCAAIRRNHLSQSGFRIDASDYVSLVALVQTDLGMLGSTQSTNENKYAIRKASQRSGWLPRTFHRVPPYFLLLLLLSHSTFSRERPAPGHVILRTSRTLLVPRTSESGVPFNVSEFCDLERAGASGHHPRPRGRATPPTSARCGSQADSATGGTTILHICLHHGRAPPAGSPGTPFFLSALAPFPHRIVHGVISEARRNRWVYRTHRRIARKICLRRLIDDKAETMHGLRRSASVAIHLEN